MHASAHLTADQLARLARGSVTPAEMLEMETHLVGCESCLAAQAEQAELRRMLPRPRRTERPRLPWVGLMLTGAALLAGLVLILWLARTLLVPPPRAGTSSPGTAVHRPKN